MEELLDSEVIEQRLEIVHEHIRLENAHDLASLMGTFGSAANYDDRPWNEHHRGIAAVTAFYEELLRVLPDLHIEVCNEHATPDAVVVECIISGTHQGAWRGLPPTGRHIEFPVCGIYTFDVDGKLAGERIYYDRATILRQLGIFRETSTLRTKLLLFMNHPLALSGAWLRRSRKTKS